ncbi:MAG: ABC transporter permease [Myxococcales bacterium]|nr:ABC transporter permease [Myxococcales bacterium]
MSPRAIATVFGKELRDVLRDRRALMFLLVLPILAIPALMWLTTEITVHFAQKLSQEKLVMLVLNPEAAPDLWQELRRRGEATHGAKRLAEYLARHRIGREELERLRDASPRDMAQLLSERGVRWEELEKEIAISSGGGDIELTGGAIANLAFPPNLDVIADTEREFADPAKREERLAEAVRTERIAAAMDFSKDAQGQIDGEGSAKVRLYYLESSDRSELAKNGMVRLLRQLGAEIVERRLQARGLPDTFNRPLVVRPERLPGAGLLVKLMSQLLPYLIILFAFLGAVYPAIDLGAGEKERGTLETLLVAPVERLDLVLGKFLVVTLAAMISALLTALSLAVSLRLGMFAMLSQAGADSFSFSLGEAALSLLLVVPTCCIFAAGLLMLSLFSRSFKEAQSAISPLQTLLILPAFVSFLPGVKLDWGICAVPVVNVTLALKEVFTGNMDRHLGHIGLILASTAVYAALMLWAAAWWSRRERVLFRG